MEKDSRGSYRGIMRGTAIFGGTQIVNIIVNVVRGKLVAVILGPVGMGISSLFTSSLIPIQQFISLGIPLSSVRSLSIANNSNDENRKNSILVAFRRLILLTALLGSFFTLFASNWLSRITFGNNSHTLGFALLSIYLFMSIIIEGQKSILQGFRQLKSLAICSIVGPIFGLLVGIPIYYVLGYDGIVPAMIILTVVSILVTTYSVRKIKIGILKQTWKETWLIGKELIVLGIVMMVAGLMGNLTNYSLNAFIRLFGSVTDVGLYQAANSITNQYVGLVFTAMATDYFPHLSSVMNNKLKALQLINQESEIVILIVTPIAIAIILTTPVLIHVLLTEEFYPVVDMIRFMGLSIILKAAYFPLGYISVAKGDRKYYFCMEGVFVNIKTFFIFAFAYYFYGFKGLGFATLISSMIDIVISIMMTKWRYGVMYRRGFFKLFTVLFSVAVLCLLCSFIENSIMAYVSMTICMLFACMYSYYELDKRVSIKNLFIKKFR